MNFDIYLVSLAFNINFSIMMKCSILCCCILLSSTLQLMYFNFDYRKDRKMALVTLTSTEEAIDALIVSFILQILKIIIPTQGFHKCFQQEDKNVFQMTPSDESLAIPKLISNMHMCPCSLVC